MQGTSSIALWPVLQFLRLGPCLEYLPDFLGCWIMIQKWKQNSPFLSHAALDHCV